MKKLIMAALAALALVGCTDVENTVRVLEQNGYTDVKTTGYDWLACSKDDGTSTGFVATSPSGHQVKGAVCAGYFFKSSTIRFN